MDPNIQNYLERTLDVLLAAGAEATEKAEIQETRGGYTKLEAIIRFPDGSLLEVNLTLSTTRETPLWLAYSFHYMNEESQCIFRYDNADHHRGLPNFPHHKHEGQDERISDCPQPSIRVVRDEIESYLRADS